MKRTNFCQSSKQIFIPVSEITNRQNVWKRQRHEVHGQHQEKDADHESGEQMRWHYYLIE